MTVMMRDVHEGLEHGTDRARESRFDEVLYADDTIVVSETTERASALIREIEEEGINIGLKLNKMRGNTDGSVWRG